MNNYQVTNLRDSFDQQDFRTKWMNIATDIKIRKYNQLDNIPEFRQLPSQFQNQIRTSETTSLNGDYQFLDKQQYFNRFYVVLPTKQTEKYLALYQETKPSLNTRALLTGIGIGSIFFIWNILKYLEYSQKLTTNRSSYNMTTFNRLGSYTSKHYFMVILTVLSPIAAYFLTQKWLSSGDLRHKQLVYACMLKKLESIGNSG